MPAAVALLSTAMCPYSVAVLSLPGVWPVSAQSSGSQGERDTLLATDGSSANQAPRCSSGARDLETNPHPGFRTTAAYALPERWGVEGRHMPSVFAASK